MAFFTFVWTLLFFAYVSTIPQYPTYHSTNNRADLPHPTIRASLLSLLGSCVRFTFSTSLWYATIHLLTFLQRPRSPHRNLVAHHHGSPSTLHTRMVRKILRRLLAKRHSRFHTSSNRLCSSQLAIIPCDTRCNSYVLPLLSPLPLSHIFSNFKS